MSTKLPRQLSTTKTVSYGGIKSQFFLWQKSLLLFPLWAIVLVPLLGLAFRTISPAMVQTGFGLLIALGAAYFFEDVLKRKIRIDEEYIFFGYRTIKIQDLIAVDLAFNKGKLLPRFITLQSATGPTLKLSLDGLSDRNVETLLKTLQARNSQLKTAPVLTTLLKCRQTSKKVAAETDHLEVPYHTRKVFGESYEAFVASAHKWIRLGPVVAFILFSPVWLQFMTQLYVFLQRNPFLTVEKLDVRHFLFHLMASLQLHFFNFLSTATTTLNTFTEQAVVGLAAAAFILAVVGYLLHVLLRPNVLVANKKGVQLGLRLGYLFVPFKVSRWPDISSATLVKGRESTVQTWKIRLHKRNGKHFDLKLGAIEPEDRQRILKRMETEIPECVIEADLAQSMLPTADRSYTEIWLQSLSQAPEVPWSAPPTTHANPTAGLHHPWPQSNARARQDRHACPALQGQPWRTFASGTAG